jgi:polyhydroxyalkanoate synthesis regulator protein
MLPVAFLRQLIRFYGDSLQALVPRYLEFSMEHLTRDQQKLRDQMSKTFGPAAFHAVEDQVRANMAFFTEAMRLFSPFSGQAGAKPDAKPAPEPEASGQSASELDALKRQMADMEAKLDALSRK